MEVSTLLRVIYDPEPVSNIPLVLSQGVPLPPIDLPDIIVLSLGSFIIPQDSGIKFSPFSMRFLNISLRSSHFSLFSFKLSSQIDASGITLTSSSYAGCTSMFMNPIEHPAIFVVFLSMRKLGLLPAATSLSPCKKNSS